MKNDRKKSTPRFNKEICTACTMCVDICPMGVLDLAISNSPHGFRRFPFLVLADKCTGCFSCEKQCPVGAITMTP
jgi:NAD-dependent dihydropyrimidine dehydrogenase PreA subunit